MKLSGWDPRVRQCRRRGLLIDTNLLLHYLSGQIGPQSIAAFNRTRQFVSEDFLLLKQTAGSFSSLVTTPGILTEVSNLAGGGLNGERRDQYFARSAAEVQLLTEEYVPSTRACNAEAFTKFGLTDSAIILAGKDRYLTITTDAALAGYMQRNQLDVIHFNNICLQNWT